MLGFVESPPHLAVLTPGGRRFVEASADDRKVLWRDRLLTLQLFREVHGLLQTDPDHEITDYVLETIVMRMPYEDYEQVFRTFVNWSRFGQLFNYDAGTQRIGLVAKSNV